MDQWMFIISYALCFIPVVVIFVVMPYIGRRTVCFGISIPSAQFGNEELAALRKRYAKSVAVVGTLMSAAFITLVFIVPEGIAALLLGVFLLAYLTAAYALYLRRWRQVREIKARMGWVTEARSDAVADTRFFAAKRAVSPAWFALHALIIVATVLVGALLYDRIPSEVIMQTDIAGNVTSTAVKTPGLILFAPAIQATVLLTCALVYWLMLRTPPVIDPDNPQVSSRQNAAFRYRWSAWTVAFGAVLLLAFLTVQLSVTQLVDIAVSGWASIFASGAAVVSALALSLTTGQSGSRVRLGKKADGKVIRREDDRYWKWGSFYVNRDDPALFVEKRFGVGFTVNFGRPAAVALFIGLIALIVAVSIFVPMLSK